MLNVDIVSSIVHQIPVVIQSGITKVNLQSSSLVSGHVHRVAQLACDAPDMRIIVVQIYVINLSISLTCRGVWGEVLMEQCPLRRNDNDGHHAGFQESRSKYDKLWDDTCFTLLVRQCH